MTASDLQAKLDKVRDKYSTWILGSIRKTYDSTKHEEGGSTPLAAFILLSCAIDFFAGFLCGITSFKPGKVSANYKEFVKKYLSSYDAQDIYTNVRCRLAHNYTIGGNVALTHMNEAAHDPLGKKGGRRTINFENFLGDFQKAVEKYFEM